MTNLEQILYGGIAMLLIGALFLWLWLPRLPISSAALYQRLKARGVLVLSGHHFFPGLSGDWPHTQQCIRITYCRDEASVRTRIRIIGDELRQLHQQAR